MVERGRALDIEGERHMRHAARMNGNELREIRRVTGMDICILAGNFGVRPTVVLDWEYSKLAVPYEVQQLMLERDRQWEHGGIYPFGATPLLPDQPTRWTKLREYLYFLPLPKLDFHNER